MSARETMVTAETEEALRVMAHIRDLNRSIAEQALAAGNGAMPRESMDRAVSRLEELPFLLADFRFSDTPFWRTGALETVSQPNGAVHSQAQIQLARHLLCVAWHCGRAGAGPRLLLGITREVGSVIAALGFVQIDAIALARADEVHLRWAEVPGFWSQMLEIARADNDQHWSRFQVHALRLLGRECI